MMTTVREQTTPTAGAPDRIGTVMRALARVRVLCEVSASGNGQTIEARALGRLPPHAEGQGANRPHRTTIQVSAGCCVTP
jgi:hypothetical protein